MGERGGRERKGMAAMLEGGGAAAAEESVVKGRASSKGAGI